MWSAVLVPVDKTYVTQQHEAVPAYSITRVIAQIQSTKHLSCDKFLTVECISVPGLVLGLSSDMNWWPSRLCAGCTGVVEWWQTDPGIQQCCTGLEPHLLLGEHVP